MDGGLTQKQREALAFVEAYIADHDGVSPSYVEIGAGLGIASNAGVSRLLKSLAERGYITELKGRARSIQVIRSLATPDPTEAGNMPRFQRISSLMHRNFALVHQARADLLTGNALDRIAIALLPAEDDRDLARRMRLLASALQNAAVEIAR